MRRKKRVTHKLDQLIDWSAGAGLLLYVGVIIAIVLPICAVLLGGIMLYEYLEGLCKRLLSR